MATSPHCDNKILHAPNECIYCDKYPKQQKARTEAGINFTGHGSDPATDRRTLEQIYYWHGNIPMTKELQEQEDKERDRFWKELDDNDLWAKSI